MKILFIGDIIGRPGRVAVRELLPGIVGAHNPALIIANGENAAGGFGITRSIYEELRALEIDVITTGNHIWDRKETADFIGDEDRLLRPANYPPGAPGRGFCVYETVSRIKVGVLNLSGRVFMDAIDCPFRRGDEIVERIRKETPVIVLDIHAETTSEKAAIACYFDGRVSAVVGTHTHVQTSDERILSMGTAFITDCGMTGPTDSVIGMKKEIVLKRFLTSMPVRFEVATKGVELQGVVITIDPESGRALEIERIKVPLKRA